MIAISKTALICSLVRKYWLIERWETGLRRDNAGYVVAFLTNKEKPQAAWKMTVSFGYEHVPSMLIEKEGKVLFGTRNGVVYCIDSAAQKTIWAYKIDNAMVNTINAIGDNKVIASTMDGKVCLLQSGE